MTKQYHLSDILSITTGKLVSTRHMEGVYDILNYMTGDNLFTHQLPRACRECEPILLAQHPQLAGIDKSECNKDNWQGWINGLITKYGEWLPVEPLQQGQHLTINPIAEIEAIMNEPQKVIVLQMNQVESQGELRNE